MQQNHFVQSHPLHIFSEGDTTDYSKRDKHFIQSLKAIENLMDIDAYIIDYKNQKILYATKDSILNMNRLNKGNMATSLSYLDSLIVEEDLSQVAAIHYKVYDFMYSLPANRRKNGYFTQDYRIKCRNNKTVLINQKGTILDLTKDGTLRLSLCIISFPTNDKQGNAYIKMTDTNTIYEYIPIAEKFIEVKTQKLTSKAAEVLQLASSGKTESEIAQTLGISMSTVKYHKKMIFKRLGVKNTTEAIQWMNNQKKMIKRL